MFLTMKFTTNATDREEPEYVKNFLKAIGKR